MKLSSVFSYPSISSSSVPIFSSSSTEHTFNALHHTKHIIYICIFIKNSKLETQNGLYVFEQKKNNTGDKDEISFSAQNRNGNKNFVTFGGKENQK